MTAEEREQEILDLIAILELVESLKKRTPPQQAVLFKTTLGDGRRAVAVVAIGQAAEDIVEAVTQGSLVELQKTERPG